jgi:hypothetical protein
MKDHCERPPFASPGIVFALWCLCAFMVVSFLLVLPHARLKEKETAAQRPPQSAAPQSKVLFPIQRTPHIEAQPEKAEAPSSISLRDDERMVDFALLQAMQEAGLGSYNMRVKDAALLQEASGSSAEDKGARLFQHLEIHGAARPKSFMRSFSKDLGLRLPSARVERNGPMSWTVHLGETPTHTIDFIIPETPHAEREGKLLIIIDDLGLDRKSAERLAELEIPVVFSVLPNEFDTDYAVKAAVDAEKDIFLHQPMEPLNYPEKNPGDGALYTFMSPDDIRRVVAGNLAKVPGAVAVNNHMGSAFTSAHGPMEVFLKELKARNMFFLDSLTTPKSVASLYCGRLGMRCFKRSIFLDNTAEESAVLDQLFEADYMAYATGRAVAIGHPYPATVSALEKWQKLTTRRARVVSFSLFMQHKKED